MRLTKDLQQKMRVALTNARLELYEVEYGLFSIGEDGRAQELARIETRLHEIRMAIMGMEAK